MKTLFIDTSSTYLDVSIIIDGVVFEKRIESINEHSKYALSTIEDLLRENNLKPIDIDDIMIINGPGSFTGLRIGVTIAKVYAWTLNIKIIPISTLKAYALSNTDSNIYVSVIDARRDCVYAGIYDSNYNTILKEQYISIYELYEKIKDMDILLVGDKDIKDIKAIPPILDVKKIYEYYKNNEGVNPHTLIPNYLKRVEAEEKLEG